MQVAQDNPCPNEYARRVSENREEYKLVLVELLKEVIHPPEFTERTERYAWCIRVNKLSCKLKSVTNKLASADVPRSFEDVDEFITDINAWQIGFADEVPNFYAKWPRDLDRLIEESFTKGTPLGRMKLITTVTDNGEGEGLTPQTQARTRRESAVSSAAAADADANVSSPSFESPTTAQPVTPSTPSLGWSVPSSQSLPSPTTVPRSESLSPSRRLSIAMFEYLVQQKQLNKFIVDYRHLPRTSSAEASSSSTVRDPTTTTLNDDTPAIPPTSESLVPESELELEPTPTPETESGPERSTSLTKSLRRSSSERPWIPQSYRDGSMPSDLAELFSELDEVCQAADTLIIEAEDIDARDEGETRLREWTSRARKCEVNGRKALARISSTAPELSKTDEVLYVASTLKLLKSAHVELIEYAESMLNSCIPTSVAESSTAALQPAMRNPELLGPDNSTSRSTPTEVTGGGATRLQRDLSGPGPSRPALTVRRRLEPYILLPKVPWKWRPASSLPEPSSSPSPSPESEPKPKKSTLAFLTSSITIRTRRPGPSGPSTSSDQNQNQTHHVLKLQRMTDRVPGDIEHDPPCSECAQRGFSCFGKGGKLGACRRCKRVKKGRCTYARPKGGWGATVSTSGKTPVAISTGQVKGKGKGKQKEVVKPADRRRANEGMRGKGKNTVRGEKRLRPERSSDMPKKLENARERMENNARRKNAPHIGNDRQSESEDDDEDVDVSDSDSDFDARPPLKRRRSMSARPTHEPDFLCNLASGDCPQAAVPTRATTEPPDRPVPSFMRDVSRRPRLASLARSTTSDTDFREEELYVSSPGRLGRAGSDAQTRNGERVSSSADDSDPRLQTEVQIASGPMEPRMDPMSQHQPADETEHPKANQSTIVPVIASTTQTVLPTRPSAQGLSSTTLAAPLHAECANPLSATVSVAQLSITAQPASHANLPATATLPTPTSLSSSSPSDAYVPLPTSPSVHDPGMGPNTLLIASLATKLDTLIASQAALTSEVQAAQAKLALQAGIIEEVREALRVLKAPASVEMDVVREMSERLLLEN